MCAQRNQLHKRLATSSRKCDALAHQLEVNEQSREAARSVERDYDEVSWLGSTVALRLFYSCSHVHQSGNDPPKDHF